MNKKDYEAGAVFDTDKRKAENDLSARVDSNTADIKSLKKEISDLKKEIAGLKKENTDLKKEIAELKGRYDTLRDVLLSAGMEDDSARESRDASSKKKSASRARARSEAPLKEEPSSIHEVYRIVNSVTDDFVYSRSKPEVHKFTDGTYAVSMKTLSGEKSQFFASTDSFEKVLVELDGDNVKEVYTLAK